MSGTTTIAQFSRDGRGFGAAALERARAAGLSDDAIRQQVPQAGLVFGPKAAAALGVALDEVGDQA